MYVSGLANLFKNSGFQDAFQNVLGDDSIDSDIILARVLDVCLNTNSSLYNSWNDIGVIQYQDISQPASPNTQNKSSTLSKPLLPGYKTYPLVDEYVIIFRGPSDDNPESSGKHQYYYLPINLFNTQHANIYPGLFENKPNINGKSGGKFVEKGDIHPVLPFAGDNIIEGRNGNSIRLGATANTDGEIKNNWSDSGNEGNPIIILKNGQPAFVDKSEGFIPITEDINEDPSSIYLTSNQQIPINIATSIVAAGERDTIPYTSVIDKNPISPKSYVNPQIILNSGRLLFNTIGDSILMSSQKSIVLESREDLGIKSMYKNVNILAPEGNISLGKRNANQSAVLGDNLMEYLIPIMSNMKILVERITKEPQLTTSKLPAQTLINMFSQFINNYQKTLSDKIKLS